MEDERFCRDRKINRKFQKNVSVGGRRLSELTSAGAHLSCTQENDVHF